MMHLILEIWRYFYCCFWLYDIYGDLWPQGGGKSSGRPELPCRSGLLGSIAHMVYELLIEHKSSENMVSSYFDSDDPIRPQLCTCHDSLAVMTCAKLWPDLIGIFHMRATYIFTKFVSQSQNPVVKWTSVLRKYFLVEPCCTMDQFQTLHTFINLCCSFFSDLIKQNELAP